MPIRSLIRLVLSVLGVGLLIVACNQSASLDVSQTATPSASSAQPAQTAAVTVKMGFNNWPGFMPWKVADEKNLFEKHGVKAEITWFGQLSDMLNAYNTGRVDTTALTTGDLISGVVQGIQQKTILMMGYSNGGDGILATNNVKSVADFKGKTVYVEQGTVSEHMLLLALKKYGLTDTDVNIVNTPGDTAGTSFAAGKADIAVTYEPYLSKGAATRGTGRVIFSSKDLPGLLPDLMTLRQDWLEQNPAIAQGLVDTWFDALRYQQEHPEEALAIQAKQAGVKPEEFVGLRDGLKFLTPEEAMLAFDPKDKTISLYTNGAGIGQFLYEKKLIDKEPPNMDSLIDDRFLKAHLAKQPT